MDIYNQSAAMTQGNQLLNQAYTVNDMRNQQHAVAVEKYNKTIQGDKREENIDDIHHALSAGTTLPSKLYQAIPGTQPFKQAVALQRDFNAQRAAGKALSAPGSFIQTSIAGKTVKIPTTSGAESILTKVRTTGTTAEKSAAEGLTGTSSIADLAKGLPASEVLAAPTGAGLTTSDLSKPGGYTQGLAGAPAETSGTTGAGTKVSAPAPSEASSMGTQETQVRQKAAITGTEPDPKDLSAAKDADTTAARGGLAAGESEVKVLGKGAQSGGVLDTVLQGPEGIFKAVARKAGAGDLATRVAGKVGGNALGAGLDLFDDIKNVASGKKFFQGTGKSDLDEAGNALTLGAGALDAASLAIPILAPFAALTDLVAGGLSTAGAVADEINKKKGDIANKPGAVKLAHPEQMTQMGLIASQGHNPVSAIRGTATS